MITRVVIVKVERKIEHVLGDKRNLYWPRVLSPRNLAPQRESNTDQLQKQFGMFLILCVTRYLLLCDLVVVGSYFTVDLVLKVFPVGSVIDKYALQVQLPRSRENKLQSQLDQKLSSQCEAFVTT
jgi:hypothetical protein